MSETGHDNTSGTPSGIGRWGTVVLDGPDVARLADFYAELTGWTVTGRDDDWVQLRSASGQDVAFQLAPDHRAPTWPTQERPQQLHLDLLVDGHEAAAERAVSLGATRVGEGTSWITLTDPAGHPFDLCQKDGLTGPMGLYGVTFDAPDASALARFYAELLGLEVTWDGPEGAMASGHGTSVLVQPVAEYNAPAWPDPARPQQGHLDVMVDDIDDAERRVLAIGATSLGSSGEDFRVFADPAGHPFCLCWNSAS